jgi:hypothetical protein
VAITTPNAVYDIVSNALSQFSYGKWLGRAAQVVIAALGLIAALSQIGIAMSVTVPVLIAALATIGGVIVVGVGGGLIQPMRARWERVLNKAEGEGTRVATHLRTRAETDATTKDRGDRIAQPGYSSASASRDVKAADRAASDRAASDRAASERAAAGRAAAGRAASDRAASDRAASDRAEEERGATPGRDRPR